MKFFLKFWPIIFILIIWFIFASPYFIKGLVPYSSTYQVNHFAPWDAYKQFWGPVKNGAMPDVTSQIYPWKHLVIELWKNGTVPLWNPYSFSGTPLLANYQSAVLSPFNILFFLTPHFIDAWSILVLFQPLLAGIFMYLFIRVLKRSKAGSLVGSISFMFCGFMTVWMGYATLDYAILYLPLSLFCVESYFNLRKTVFLFILSLIIPLSFFSGHFQISIYFLIVTLGYIVYKLYITHDYRSGLYVLLYSAFGILLTLPQILPSVELYANAIRSRLFEKTEFIPWSYSPTFLSPDFFGNPVTGNDWFGHYAEWNSYIGIVPFLLAFYAIISKKSRHILFLLILSLLSILLAFNTPLLDFMVRLHIPVLSTSAASRIIVLFSFAFAALSAFGYDFLLEDIVKNKYKKIFAWIGGFTFVFVLIWLVVRFGKITVHDNLAVTKHNLLFSTLIFIAFSLMVLIVIVLFNKFKIKNRRFILRIVKVIIITIVAFDMLRFAAKWQAFDPSSLVFPQVATTKAFAKISGYHRVMGNFGAEDSVYYHLPITEGYDALYNKRYGEFIASLDDGKIKDSSRSVVIFPKEGIFVPKAINLLDIRYLVHKIADGRFPWAFPFWTYPNNQFKLIYEDSQYQFYRNTKAFPHAFLVGKYRVVSEPQKIIDTMFNKGFNLRHEVILEKNIGKLPKTNKNPGNASITDYTANKIKLSVSAKSKSILFLSEVFYPGWTAFVDGRQVNIYRADYTFRAIVVPAGIHKVDFVYNPSSFNFGVYFAFLGIFLISATTVALERKWLF